MHRQGRHAMQQSIGEKSIKQNKMIAYRNCEDVADNVF